MAKSKVIWLDERVSDFTNEPWDFTEKISKHVDLIVCGEGNKKGKERAPTCLETFSSELKSIYQSKSSHEIAGFILDVHIPVRHIGRLGDQLRPVTTNNGADTGFQIARYLLSNDEPHLSPYGSAFKDIPVLFFSISRFVPSDFTSWMGDGYKPFDPENMSKFMHLEKDLDVNVCEHVEKWIVAALEWKIKKAST